MKHLALLGEGVHLTRWANALADRVDTVDVYSLGPRPEELRASVYFQELPVKRPYGYVLNAWDLRRRLRIRKPQLLNTHFGSGYGTLGRLSKFRPHVLSVWGSDVYEFPDRSRWRRRLLRANLEAADLVCSTSHVMAERTRQVWGRPAELPITPFGVDTQLFAPTRPVFVDASKIVVGTVKTLKPNYGIDVLLRGFALCLYGDPPLPPDAARRLHLRITGGGPDRGPLERLARELKIAAVTTFVGPTPHREVPRELNALDIYVALSRCEESFGVAIIEASACGRPVIVSNMGGLPEVVRDGVTGLIVPREDPAACAAALRRLLAHPDEARALGAAGREHVAGAYEWEACVDKMLAVYEQTLRKARAA